MKSMNRRESKKIAVMAAVIVGLMMFAFMPLASAEVTSFTVTPSTGLAGAVDSYDVKVTTTGVTSIDITIPEGFIAVAPKSGGVLIAEVNFWNSTAKAYYGYATITANNTDPTEHVDVVCKLGADEIRTTEPISYAPGATSTFESGFACDTSSAIIKLPTETKNGSINITINCSECPGFSDTWRLDDVMIAIKQFVRNPLTKGDYVFSADGVDETVTITAPEGQGIAVFRDGMWYVDTDGDRVADKFFWYGLAGDDPVVGDINQDGVDDMAVFRNGRWYVDTTGDHVADVDFWYGIAGDVPVVGDIDQDGRDDTIIFRNGRWYVDTDYNQAADLVFWYGTAGDNPVVGDINQDGLDDTVVVRNGNWYVDTDKDQVQNYDFVYGLPTDEHQLARDINKNGLDDVVVFRDGYWYVFLKGITTYGAYTGQEAYWFGIVDDVPAAGYFR
jgi:hypothetical protein